MAYNNKTNPNIPAPQNFEAQADGLKSMAPPAFQLAANPIQKKTEEKQNTSDNTTTDSPITLSGSVGKGGKNYVKDVKAIQNKLLEMGFFSYGANYEENVTLFEKMKDTDTIDAGKISQTIAAITQYEVIVEYKRSTSRYDRPTGKVSKSGETLKLMNAAMNKPAATELQTIATKRAQAQPQITKGGPFKLGGAVGNTSSGNRGEDISKVQNHLVQLGKLSASVLKKESPEALLGIHPGCYDECMDKVMVEHIPQTIAAIKKFQTKGKFRHSYWQKKKLNEQKLSDYTYTEGIIAPGDLSELILSNYRQYKFSFKDGDGKDETVTKDNFQTGGHTHHAEGVSIQGDAEATGFTVEDFKKFGVTDLEARALQFVSRNEGGFDAVNTYDRARVSFGFIQFAGGSGGGTFPIFLATLKKENPAKFKERFGDFGVEVEYTTRGEKIAKATVVAIDPTKDGKVLRGQEAEAYIKSNIEFTTVMVNAGNDKEVQRSQIQTAASQYVVPSRNSKFSSTASTSYLKYTTKEKKEGKEVDKKHTLMGAAAKKFAEGKEYEALPDAQKEKLSTLSLKGEKVSDYLTSEKARAITIDLYINKGSGGGPEAMSAAIRDYIQEKKITSKSKLKSASEIEILKKVKKYTDFGWRIDKAINDASLSS